MPFTIAEARGDFMANMHCAKGHKFSLRAAYKDRHGTWCPECGNSAHSYSQKDCPFEHTAEQNKS